jgi:hypothetical protein
VSYSRRLLLVALAVLGATSGCARDLETCDITERACQETVYYRLLSLRGDGYDPFGGLPPISVITEAEFRSYLEAEAARRAAEDGPDPWDTALALLRFTRSSPAAPDGGVSPDGGDSGSSTIDDEVEHVLAYYDSESKTVTVISHPNQTGAYVRENAMVTLAHELVHALQDRELDLGAPSHPVTLDEYLARNGLIEGDARFYEDLFTADMLRMMGRTPPDVTTMPDQELDYAYANFEELGSSLFAAQYFMYPLGAKYVAAAYRAGGNAAVRRAYGQAPKQTVRFLVGEDGRAPPGGTGAACSPPAVVGLPSGMNAAGADQFGAVALYTFLRGWGVDHATAFAGAQSWTGDYMQVQADESLSTVAVAWRVELSAAPPDSIPALLQTSGELAVATGHASLEITAAVSPATVVWQPTANCP